ncbi:MAG: hypothetical protein SVO26_07005 [Chloroflexota bacterium]|nr:hypothetical protein [Chloroflexota bacterium]
MISSRPCDVKEDRGELAVEYLSNRLIPRIDLNSVRPEPVEEPFIVRQTCPE